MHDRDILITWSGNVLLGFYVIISEFPVVVRTHEMVIGNIVRKPEYQTDVGTRRYVMPHQKPIGLNFDTRLDPIINHSPLYFKILRTSSY